MSEIGERAFLNCTELSEIQLPNGLTEIKDYTFCRCGFNSFVLPEGVTVIREGAFSYSPNLTQITVPKSVTRIEEDAFGACVHLKTIIYEGTVAEWNANTIGESLFYYTRVICTDGEVER